MFPFVVMAVAFWGTVLGGGAYFARRFARAAERRSGNEQEIAQLTSRLAALEEALDGARQDIDRLETGLEFTTRLLASRADAGERAT